MCLFEKIRNKEYQTKIPYPAIDASEKDKMAYVEDAQRLAAKFQDDLFEHFGVSDNSKRLIALEIAYDRCHSGGMEEIAIFFENLVPLLR